MRLDGGAHALGIAEAPQAGRGRVAAGSGVVDDRTTRDVVVEGDAVAVYQTMPRVGMRVVIEIAFLGGKPVQERQVCIACLHAIFARQVFVGADLFVVGDALALDHVGHDLGRGQVLIDAPIGT
ncbi:hypothetical protein D3C86_1745550 [compost metagenome]